MALMDSGKIAGISLLCFVAGALAGSLFVDHLHRQQPLTDTNIAFPGKAYSDSGDVVTISGRLAGKGIGYKNNVETITCYKQDNECQLQDVEQIGPNQISNLSPALSIPITHWGDDVITMSDANVPNPTSCFHTTVNIARKREFALYVQEPTNQSSLGCQHIGNEIYKWTIEQSLWEEQAFPKR